MTITAERLFTESILEGASVRTIAKRHDMSRSTVHRMIQRGGRAFVERVHLDLLTSHGRGELPAIVLPAQAGPTLDRALDLVAWLTHELEERGVQVDVHWRPVVDGSLIVALSDRHPPRNSRAHVESEEKE